MTHSPQMLAAASASIPDAAALPAREVASLAPRAGFKNRAPGEAPAVPGAHYGAAPKRLVRRLT